MAKGKEEIQRKLVKKNRLRAKELAYSKEYAQDLQESKKYRVGLIYLLRKYQLKNLVSQETLREVADGKIPTEDVFQEWRTMGDFYDKKYRPSVEAIDPPLGKKYSIITPETKGNKDHEVYLDADGLFYVAIDPRRNKEDILFRISKMLDVCAENGIVNNRRFREERIRDLEVYRLWALKKTVFFPVLDRHGHETGEYRKKVAPKTFKEIGAEMGMAPEAARKARNRAYEFIHGTPYKGRSAKAKIEKTFLKKDCATCGDNPVNGGNCQSLCAEVLAYVEEEVNRKDIPGTGYDLDTITTDLEDLPAKRKGQAH